MIRHLMKKSPARRNIVIVAIILCVVLLVGIPGITLIRPDIMAEILPYSIVKQYLLYDHITYHGVDYYLMDQAPLSDDHDEGFVKGEVYVVLVNQEGVPYKDSQMEPAWLLANDPDTLYIYFNSAYYTRDKSLASEMYGFNK